MIKIFSSFLYDNKFTILIILTPIIITTLLLKTSSSQQEGGWSQQMTGMGVDNLTCVQAISPSIAIASVGYYSAWPYANVFQFYKTTNGGTNWTLISSGNFCYINTIQFLNENTGYAAGGYTGLQPQFDKGQFILKTTNGGVNWTTAWYMIISELPVDIDIKDLHFINANTGWACSSQTSILRTTNGGLNFTFHVITPYFYKKAIFFVNSQKGWTAGDSGRIASTSNGGLNWNMQPDLMTQTINSLYFLNEQTGYACNSTGYLFNTTNAGTNWTSTQIASTPMHSIFYTDENHGWIAGTDRIIGYDTSFFNSYSSGGNLKSISFCDTLYGWACGGSHMLYTSTGGTTRISSNNNSIPAEYILEQNYPNPFNPYTTINYGLPNNGTVKLTVYNLLGKKVAALVNDEYKSAGSHSTTFDGSTLSSGVYLYLLDVNDGKNCRMVKKMILTK